MKTRPNCKIEGCGKIVHVLKTGLCNPHYLKMRRYGNPLADLTAKRDSARLSHGACKTSEWKSWTEMRQRCSNPKGKLYPYYGGRGITVCERWDGFKAFIADMGNKPTPSHSLDRIDNNGNYEPANCRWATKKEQARNRRSNAFVVIGGERMLRCEARERGLISNAYKGTEHVAEK